jgi:hypothetical protein
VIFDFTVQESSTATGQIVNAAPTEPLATTAPTISVSQDTVPPPITNPWLYNINALPENSTDLSWDLSVGEVLLLTGGKVLFNGYYCGDDSTQICVIIVTATENETVTFSHLIAGQNWLGITTAFDSEQALSNIESQFWQPPNCRKGCLIATVAFYIDNQQVDLHTLHK